MIHTASSDNFLQNQGIPSYFEAVCDCLNRQSFRAFEFIYIDTFYEDNQENFAKIISTLPFQVKHVPIHPGHRYWYDLNHIYISAAKNTGILYADGGLIVTCDDGEFFPEDFLLRYWQNYNNGYLTHSYHKRMTNIKTENGKPIYPIDGDIYINDHRAKHVENQQTYPHKHGTWAFAGSSFTLVQALQLNGFNEKMDGCKSLEDCDFGTRLGMVGAKFILDKEAYLYIVDHQSYSEAAVTIGPDGQQTMPLCSPVKQKNITNLIAIENYGICRCSVELLDVRANCGQLTDKHFEIIKRETLRYRGFDPLAEDNKANLDIWLKTPNFDLKKERQILRESADWKWHE